MKKIIALLLAACMLLGMVACSKKEETAPKDEVQETAAELGNKEQEQAEASGLSLHKIGVATYDINDAQIRMFKNYLDGYIKECFPDVTFLYSESISSGEGMMNFLQICADNDVEGIMLFYTNDLKEELDFCAEHGMYVVRGSGNVADEVFQEVADNPYFLGEIGPGAELEIQAAEDMVSAMSASGDEKNFVVLSGGAIMGNEMHRLRTVAFLNKLEEIYGMSLEKTPEELALVSETTVIEFGNQKIAICPGYMEIPQYQEAAEAVIAGGEYSDVLATIPVTPLMDALNSVEITCGSTDCFSEDNYFGFKKGKISYIAGKYESEIGPAFAALYNAVTGHAEDFRDNGRAFRLQQGFWTAADSEEYDVRYALASGAVINAYNYDDLYSVVKELNPDATFAAFKTLVDSWTYEDCLARRSE